MDRPADRPAHRCAVHERDGHVATITYNRPHVLNAINGELRQDLNAAWNRFREDEDAWVGIVTGAGPRVLRRRGPAGRPWRGRRVAGQLLGDPDCLYSNETTRYHIPNRMEVNRFLHKELYLL